MNVSHENTKLSAITSIMLDFISISTRYEKRVREKQISSVLMSIFVSSSTKSNHFFNEKHWPSRKLFDCRCDPSYYFLSCNTYKPLTAAVESDHWSSLFTLTICSSSIFPLLSRKKAWCLPGVSIPWPLQLKNWQLSSEVSSKHLISCIIV